ncbi:hypothetical protein [Ignicoccus hospitalis]|uniref:Uncharacterized protein n=1 Tax=Ignicoccus hospitalis (strain KIN4/I / DSM 18386 / JCM 14125) TaxID=453591 RepID=A8AAI5_IGNH4|nr:hypothetical protein [Ignicoccus hospitalis]ABU81937.1 hypothetical protein Igni_0755 [Ignicoccus hospitalis KIN4/I]HIH89904.1 hypothetical protein [Desulfurococcaceae archaeon]
MILTTLLMSVHHVCCFSIYTHWVVVALYGGSVQLYGQGGALEAFLELPGTPACLAGPYAVVPHDGGVSIYYLKPLDPVRVGEVWFVPSRCHADEGMLALASQESNVSVILDLVNNITYVMPQSNFVKVYDGIIVVVRNKEVEVHKLLGGFNVTFKSRVNDVDLDHLLYVCTEDGLYAVNNGNEVELISQGGCERVDAEGGTLVFSRGSNLFIYNGTEIIQRLSFERGVDAVGITSENEVVVLSGDTLYSYIIVKINDKTLAIILGVPLLVAAVDLLQKIVRLRD